MPGGDSKVMKRCLTETKHRGWRPPVVESDLIPTGHLHKSRLPRERQQRNAGLMGAGGGGRGGLSFLPSLGEAQWSGLRGPASNSG